MVVLHLLKTAVGASWALRQTTELVKLGVTVHLALPAGPMVEKYQKAGVVVHLFDPSISIKKPWQNLAKAKHLKALVAQIKPDIVHSHFVATTLLMRFALRKHNVKKIFHVPGPLHLEHWLFRTVDLKSANRNDFWLASCMWTKQTYLRHNIEKNRVGLAYYGVNESDFCFEREQKISLKQQLGISEDTFLLGMVAFFYAPKSYLGQKRGLKGHEDLIDALALVKQTHPKIACVFVGGPWGNTQHYFDQVKRYAEDNAPELCFFLGTRNDVPQLYPQFDLAVHPSHSENVGGAVESMYAGVSTLTSNVGGFPDLVEDGITGYMANAKDPVSLANKIIEAMGSEQERQKRIEKARVRVAQVMNVQHNAKQVYDFYQHILAFPNQENS
ncbi:glycosyltransferase family 4 protein [Aliiglaciecola lipolytica]|uniref:Glycosyl transferase, group 1 n=1 Tax=Aliiglaciecola lipolytica E3 TaxID=1127673 RepID=K6YCA5_9ALTE|nr:glycosyltransferase family 4 protein [Aliiglaciecola lipolytica]GAC15802.1 glycosyl transferase, group 1 [Aliiglaciecola lipolytica E3]